MTIDDTTLRYDPTSRLEAAASCVHPLLAVVQAAAAIRPPPAFWPNTHHNDKVFQDSELAWRVLGHTGVVSREWREGMHGWLLPKLVAGPVAIGDWLWPAGMGAFVLPRPIAAVASLSIVVSAWMYGARVTKAGHGVR